MARFGPTLIFIICSFDAVTVIISIGQYLQSNVVKIAKPNNRQLKTSVGVNILSVGAKAYILPTIIPETDKGVRKRAASIQCFIFFI
jgi:hypothetical protein